MKCSDLALIVKWEIIGSMKYHWKVILRSACQNLADNSRKLENNIYDSYPVCCTVATAGRVLRVVGLKHFHIKKAKKNKLQNNFFSKPRFYFAKEVPVVERAVLYQKKQVHEINTANREARPSNIIISIMIIIILS